MLIYSLAGALSAMTSSCRLGTPNSLAASAMSVKYHADVLGVVWLEKLHCPCNWHCGALCIRPSPRLSSDTIGRLFWKTQSAESLL